MSITQREYAKYAGLSQPRVSQLVAVGMPLESIEAADNFRAQCARTLRKPPPSHSETSSAAPAADVAFEGADSPEYDPEATYERQKTIERAAYDQAQVAVAAGRVDASRLIGIHALAAKNLADAREQVLKARILEKSLVSGDWVRQVMQEHDGAVVTLLRAMPKQIAARICPHDPEFAEAELDRWVQEICLKTLSDTDPWKVKNEDPVAR